MYQISNQTISAAVTEALRKQTRTFKNRISFGYWTQSGTFVSQHTITSLRSLSVTQNGIASAQLSMSGCPTSELRAEFNTTAAQRSYAFKGRLCFVECGVVYNGSQVAYIPIGYFNITEAATENDWQTVTVKGYDFAQSWTEKFSAAGATASALLGDFCNSKHIVLLPGTGVSARLSARTVTPEELAILQSLSEREAVAALAGLVGCNARMNAENKLSVRFFDALPASVPTAQTIPPALQWQGGFKKTSDAVFQLAAVTSNDNENTEDGKSYPSGNGTGVFFSNPIIKRSDINAIPGYSWMKSGNQPRTYQPCEVEWRGDPRVECGDVMQASYKNADYTVLVARQEIDLTGGFSQRITCPAGDGEISFDTLDRETRRALNRQYTALEAALAAATQAINGAEGGYVEINDTDGDGNPDEILIKADEGGTGGIIRMNKAGIGFSTNGGYNYVTTIGFGGIAAENIVSGKISTDRLNLGAIGNGIKISGNQVTGLDSTVQSILDTKDLVTSSDLNGYATQSYVSGQLASYAKANKVTLLTDDGIYTGSITTEQINVGWSGANFASSDSDHWSISPTDKPYIIVEKDSTSNLPKLRMYNNYSSGTVNCVSNALYAAAGINIVYSANVYVLGNTSSSVSVGILKMGTSGSVTLVDYVQTSTRNSVQYISKSYTVTENGYYRCILYFNNCNSGSYVSNLSMVQSVTGEMIVNGQIKSTDGETYFDLNNSEIVSSSEDYKATLTSAALLFNWSSYATGGIAGYDGNGSVDLSRLVVYSPRSVEIGIGNNATGAIGTGINVSGEGLIVFGDLKANGEATIQDSIYLKVGANGPSVALVPIVSGAGAYLQALAGTFEIKGSSYPTLSFLDENGHSAEIWMDSSGNLWYQDARGTHILPA